MTPKEKAIELMNRFEHQYNLGICDEVGIRGIDYDMAKQCALIAVDEIIDIYWNLPGCGIGSKLEYWQEVKKEIDEL
jgi:hypothetical protein